MHYQIAKNGEQTGSLDESEVRRRLASGELSGTDLGWREGMAEWEPLSRLFPAPAAATPPPVFSPPSPLSGTAMPTAPKQTSGLAVASLVCGISSFFCLGLPGLPAIIMGHMALSRIRRSAGALGGHGLAVGGLITGYLGFFIVGIAIVAALAVPAYNAIQVQANQMKAMNNARQLVLGMRQYSAENEGMLPASLETLYEQGILDERGLLEVPGTTPSDGGWNYRGAGLQDTADGKTIVLVSQKADRTRKKIVARLEGSAEVLPEKEVP